MQQEAKTFQLRDEYNMIIRREIISEPLQIACNEADALCKAMKYFREV